MAFLLIPPLLCPLAISYANLALKSADGLSSKGRALAIKARRISLGLLAICLLWWVLLVVRFFPITPSYLNTNIYTVTEIHSSTHGSMVSDALYRLLERPQGAFVVIVEPKSGKFVQFAGSKSEELYFDLPKQYLSQYEIMKTQEIFTKRGYDESQGYESERMHFNVSLDKDINKATELALAIIRQTYELKDDVRLELIEH